MAQKYLYVFIISAIIGCINSDIVPPVDELHPELNDSVTIELSVANNNLLGNGTKNSNPFLQWLGTVFGTTTTEHPVTLTDPNSCSKCECGIRSKKKRIVGGQETEVNEYPWMAFLTYNGRFYCGATLINDRYVLTAAHCTDGFRKERMNVVLLEHNMASNSESLVKRKVNRIVRHAGYNPSTYNNDIALVRLDTPIIFENPLRPVCLPTPGKSFTGHDGVVTGWGAIKQGGNTADILQEVSVPIISNKDCRKTDYGEKRITDNMLCAGFVETGNKDSCQGDSGGPLHVDNKALFEIVGVVSWGEGCAKPKKPGVYTRVNRYGTWIKSNTIDACYCEKPSQKI